MKFKKPFTPGYIIVIAFCIVLLSLLRLSGENHDTNREENLTHIADTLKYENGKHFYDMKLYDKSLRELQEYLEIYVHGRHRKEALWTVGSIYFKRFDYPRAIKSYMSLYEEYSNTEDGIKAYYHSGVCYMKMGFNIKAKNIFNTIIQDHPDSTYTSQSKTQLTLLGIMKSEPDNNITNKNFPNKNIPDSENKNHTQSN